MNLNILENLIGLLDEEDRADNNSTISEIHLERQQQSELKQLNWQCSLSLKGVGDQVTWVDPKGKGGKKARMN